MMDEILILDGVVQFQERVDLVQRQAITATWVKADGEQ